MRNIVDDSVVKQFGFMTDLLLPPEELLLQDRAALVHIHVTFLSSVYVHRLRPQGHTAVDCFLAAVFVCLCWHSVHHFSETTAAFISKQLSEKPSVSKSNQKQILCVATQAFLENSVMAKAETLMSGSVFVLEICM